MKTSTLQEPTISILRAGTFTSAEGTDVSLTPDILADVVASYQSEREPAPVVIGHPQMNHPAWAWVKSLFMRGGRVEATLRDVDPNFATAVRDKRYSNVSAQLYSPTHASNPSPGRWYLRHIGFLGAVPPAIKGLGQVSFAAAHSVGARGGCIDLAATLNHGVKISVSGPLGDSIICNEDELHSRLLAIRADHQALSFADALKVAAIDIAIGVELSSFGGQPASGYEADKIAAYRMSRARMTAAALTVATPRKSAAARSGTGEFMVPRGYSVADSDMRKYNRAKALQANNPAISFCEAAALAEHQI